MTPRVRAFSIPHGDRGIRRTVQEMRGLVHASLAEPLPVETAGAIIAPYCGACSGERALAIREFLQEYVSFVPDPVGHELLRAPGYLLERIRDVGYANGDCDDVAILGASLGMAVGLPARFVLLGFDPNLPFSHVYTELQTSGGWADLDTTAPEQFDPGLQILIWKEERIPV